MYIIDIQGFIKVLKDYLARKRINIDYIKARKRMFGSGDLNWDEEFSFNAFCSSFIRLLMCIYFDNTY